MKRSIAISLSPNTERDDVLLALKTLLSPWIWYGEKNVLKLENNFSNIFGDEYKAIAVNSGRSALYLILKALDIGYGDEVIIQAFTCVAVPNSVIWNKATPVYVDIDADYNINTTDLIKKITPRTKAVVVQNTFGMPANYQEIKEIIKAKGIYLIEDCAHSLGAKYNGKKIGTLGNIAFFSFGRDKIISSVFGGMILCKEKELYLKLRQEVDRLKPPSFHWILQQLFHLVAFSLILPIYNIQIGKLILFSLQKSKMLSRAVYPKEKIGLRPGVFPGKMPGALAKIALNQLKKLDCFNAHRQKIANFYFNNLHSADVGLPKKDPDSIWLRFPVRVSEPKSLMNFAKQKHILLGDWYKGVIMPISDYSKVGYIWGQCPNAEKLAKEIINLPTYPSLSINEVKKVIKVLKQWQKTQ